MTKAQAIYEYFSSFGITAYPVSSVPDDTVFPWLTYDAPIANMGDGDVACTVDIWYHTDSEKVPNDKAEEINKDIGIGGKLLMCDDGAIWIKRGTPFCLNIADDNDTAIKRRQLNITLEYLTI